MRGSFVEGRLHFADHFTAMPSILGGGIAGENKEQAQGQEPMHVALDERSGVGDQSREGCLGAWAQSPGVAQAWCWLVRDLRELMDLGGEHEGNVKRARWGILRVCAVLSLALF